MSSILNAFKRKSILHSENSSNNKRKSISLHSNFRVNFHRDSKILPSDFVPKFSVEEVLRKRSWKSLHTQHNKTIEKNDEDYENDLLLGNLTESIFYKKVQDNEIIYQNNIKNKPKVVTNDPFLTESPAEFLKQPCCYNKNFKKAFQSYLKGDIDLNSLQTLKNFPHVYEFDSETNKISQSKLKKPKKLSISAFNVKEQTMEESSKRDDDFNKKKGHYFDEVKKLVHNRIIYKKKMKSEGMQYRSFNSKFLENFYSINKDYVEKIKNKDLLGIPNDKKYFEKKVPSFSKMLKNCSLISCPQKSSIGTTEVSNFKNISHNKLYEDYLHLNANSYLTLLKERKQRFLKSQKQISVPHYSHLKNNPKSPSTDGFSHDSPQNFGEITTRSKETRSKETMKKNNFELLSPSKRDFKIKNYIDYKEDLDFFIKNKGVLDEELVFLNEISKIEHVDEKYIEDTLLFLKKDDKNLLKLQQFIKSKSEFDSLKREAEERKNSLKIAGKKHKKKIGNNGFSNINRNSLLPEDNVMHNGSEDDTSLPSLTEATLDGLYNQSLALQHKIVLRKSKNFASKIKQFLKLEEISKMVQRINRTKLA